MEYLVLCQCGQKVPVKTQDAGTTIHCDCGRDVAVPSLSRLRTMSGIGAYEARAIDTVRRMLAEDSLPWGETCAQSGRPTEDEAWLQVELEPDDGWRNRIWTWVGLVYLCGLWMILYGILFKPYAAHDPDNMVILPLRLERRYQRRLAWRGTQRTLRRLMSTVPVYARLLEEHPYCRIRVM
jgi:hypothetical protein